MRFNNSIQFLVLFTAADFLFTEFHEMIHMVTGRLICREWGLQLSFNWWNLSCTDVPMVYLATLAGPLFTYCMLYAGVFLLRRQLYREQLFGFLLILCNLPFARIFTAAMGGGDETTVVRMITGHNGLLINITGFLFVFVLSFPPIFILFKKLENKNKFWIVAGFSIAPLIFQWIYEFRFLDGLINKGFLAGRHLMGIADLVMLHTFLMLVIVFTSCIFFIRSRKIAV